MTPDEDAEALVTAWEKTEGISMRDGPTFTLVRQIVAQLYEYEARGLELGARLLCRQCEEEVPLEFAGAFPHHRHPDRSTGYCVAGALHVSAYSLRKLRREKP